MRFIKFVLLAVVLVVAVFIAVANRGWITVRLTPEGLPTPFPATIDLPVYGVIYASVFLGVVIGLVLEMFREGPLRKDRKLARREGRQMKKEVDRLTRKAGEEDDEILGIAH